MAANRNPALFSLAQGSKFADAVAPKGLAEARSATFNILFQTIAACLAYAGEAKQREAFAAAWALVQGMAVLAVDRRLQVVLPERDLPELASRLVKFIDLRMAEGN